MTNLSFSVKPEKTQFLSWDDVNSAASTRLLAIRRVHAFSALAIVKASILDILPPLRLSALNATHHPDILMRWRNGLSRLC